MKALLLAAGSGTRLRRSNVVVPKCLLPLADGKTIVAHMMHSFIYHGIDEVFVVTGYKAELIHKELKQFSKKIKITYIHNTEYKHTQACYSLLLALPYLNSSTIIIPSDVICNYSLMLDSIAKRSCTSLWYVERSKYSFDSMKVIAKNNAFYQATKDVVGKKNTVVGESTGIIYLNTSAVKILKKTFITYCKNKKNNLPYHACVNFLRKHGLNIHLKSFPLHFWHEVDYPRHIAPLKMFTSIAFSA